MTDVNVQVQALPLGKVLEYQQIVSNLLGTPVTLEESIQMLTKVTKSAAPVVKTSKRVKKTKQHDLPTSAKSLFTVPNKYVQWSDWINWNSIAATGDVYTFKIGEDIPRIEGVALSNIINRLAQAAYKAGKSRGCKVHFKRVGYRGVSIQFYLD